MAETIRFETNIPQEMAFTHVDGKEVEGRFGNQYWRGTADGRGVYLQPIVERKLLELEVQPGERVQILKAEVKDGRKRGVQWKVTRVDPPGQAGSETGVPAKTPPATVASQSRPNGTPQTTTPVPAKPVAPSPATPVRAETTIVDPTSTVDRRSGVEKPITHTQIGNVLKACLCAAIDAARDAQVYATNNGFPLTFSADQVQDLASTLYIQQSKQSNINLMQRNNELRAQNGGGDTWRH